MKRSIQVDGQTVRLSLREEAGVSLLNINGSHILYLNETAAAYAKLIMDEVPRDTAVASIRRLYDVGREDAERDYEQVFFSIATLATRKDVCPYSYLGVKNVTFGGTELSAPFRFDLALTYRCNNNCAHCYMGGPQDRPEYTTSQWKQVIDKADALEVGAVVFTGGEPTLRNDLVELVDYNHDLVTGLVTNGRLLTPELVSRLEAAELDHIQITVEGLEKTHDAMVGATGAYRETMAGIKAALDSHIFTLTNTTLTTQNCAEFPALLELLHGMGLSHIAVNSIIYSGKAADADYGLSAVEAKEQLEAIMGLAADRGMDLVWYTPTRRCEFDPVEMGLGLKCCSAARVNVTIEPDGTVLPCQSWFESMGNILEDPWDAIWNSELARAIRAKAYMPASCEGCEHEDNCTAGCPLERDGKGCSPLG
ncbi:MAG: radical SAM protein [Candidatus Methanofastidiosa archaeon]|nr:radical SAM protein [Candidatus Methanofastidiosa archaeon]